MDEGAERGRAGAMTTVEQLHESFAGPLFVFAVRLLGDPETAEEVVQDTLVRAWRHADRFDPARGSMAAWLFTIARNLTTDRVRRAAARPRAVATLDAVDPPLTDVEVDRALEAWQMASALQRLSQEHRTVIVEAYYRAHTVTEIAARLDIPVGTVKSRLFYGLRALRLELEEMGVVS